MNNKQASEKILELAAELEDDFPEASVIIGIVGCVTATFEAPALGPLASEAQRFGFSALSVMAERMGRDIPEDLKARQ